MMKRDVKNIPEITGQEITFGFFEDVLHLKEIQDALGRTVDGQSQEDKNVQIETGHYDGLSQEEICRTWQDAWIIPGATSKKDPNISQKLQSMRLVKLQIDRETAVYHQPSGFGYRSRQAKLTGGGKTTTKGGSTGKLKRLDLAKKRDILEKVCGGHNLKNLKFDGPYGKACTLLKMKNTKANRKRIQTFWQRHSKINAENLKNKKDNGNGNSAVTELKMDNATPKSVHPDASSVKKSKRQADSSPLANAKRIKCDAEEPERHFKTESKPQASSFSLNTKRNPISIKQTDTEYCICGANEKNWNDNGAMAECEACHQWYHFKCITKKNIKLVKETDVKFICGAKKCIYKESFLMVKGTIHPCTTELENLDYGLDIQQPYKGTNQTKKEVIAEPKSSYISGNNHNSETSSSDIDSKFQKDNFMEQLNLVSKIALKDMQQNNNLSNPRRSRRLCSRSKAVAVKKSDRTRKSIKANYGEVHQHNDTVDRQAEHDAQANTDTFYESLGKQSTKAEKISKDSPVLVDLKEAENTPHFISKDMHQSGVRKVDPKSNINTLTEAKAAKVSSSTNDLDKKSDHIKDDKINDSLSSGFSPNDLDEKSDHITCIKDDKINDSLTSGFSPNDLDEKSDHIKDDKINDSLTSGFSPNDLDEKSDHIKDDKINDSLTSGFSPNDLDEKSNHIIDDKINDSLNSGFSPNDLDEKSDHIKDDKIIDSVTSGISPNDLDEKSDHIKDNEEVSPNETDNTLDHIRGNEKVINKEDAIEASVLHSNHLKDNIQGDDNQQSEKVQESSNSFNKMEMGLPEIEKEITVPSEEQNQKENTEQSKSVSLSLDKLPAKYLIKCGSVVAKIRKILTEADDLILRSASFQYANEKSEKEYIYLEEILTQKLEALDSLEIKKFDELCRLRKRMIDLINLAISKLEKGKELYLEKVKKLNAQSKILPTSHADDNTDSVQLDKEQSNSDQEQIVNSADEKQNDLVEIKPKIPNQDICAQKMENDEEQYLFSPETISSVLGVDLPADNFFRFNLPNQSTFQFPSDVWQALCETKKGRYFKRNVWQEHFVDGIKESNPHCVFNFTNHHVSDAKQRQRKSSSPIFHAKGSCKFEGCGVGIKIEMWKLYTVTITYNGSVKHIIGEQHHRKITGEKREELKNKFMYGIKPLPQFLKEHEKLTPYQLISGNRDGLGKNSRIFSQIASEGRQLGRCDNELIKSLLYQQENMKKEINGGFIQKICASPLYILYWSNFGLDIYNDQAKHQSLFWDATGSLVRKSDEGKQFLYYELALKHPVKGKMGIPLTSMISADQSLPIISDWLRSFRHAVKKRFGHSRSILLPKMIVSDQAMVFILAALKEFNGEDMPSFLKRAWNIVNGRFQASDIQKTLIHLCASHLMNGVKRFLKKKEIGSQKMNVFLYMTGLLMNSKTLVDAEEILLDIFIVISSKTVNEENKLNYSRLMTKINNYETTAENRETNSQDSDNTNSPINPDMFTEEEFLIVGSASPFKEWTKTIKEEAMKKCDSDSNGSSNQFFSQAFAEYLTNKLMPIFPLWSSILTGDLTRHSLPSQVHEEDDIVSNTPPKTNSIIENRFRILKHICLNNRSQHRIDEFSEKLKDQTMSIQKFAVTESLNSRVKAPIRKRKMFSDLESVDRPAKRTKKSPKKNTLIEEGWGKLEQQPLNLKAKVGKYQQAPKHKFDTLEPLVIDADNSEHSDTESSVNSTQSNNVKSKSNLSRKYQNSKPIRSNEIDSFWRLKNFGSSCWFNSMFQAFFSSDISARLVEHFSNETVITDSVESSDLDKAVRSLAKLWEYMISNDSSSKRLSENMLQSVLRNVCIAIPGFTQNVQQDAQEMNTIIMAHISDLLLDSIEISKTEFCLSCDKQTIRDQNEGHTIILHLQPGLSGISVQTLLDNHFCTEEEFCKECNACQKDSNHKMSRTVKRGPKTLAIVLGRYHHENLATSKLHNVVYINEKISLRSEASKSEKIYKFKSAVCHHGNSANSGHYVAIVKKGNQYICCNDSIIEPASSDDLLETAYVLVYDKENEDLPQFVGPFMSCFKANIGLSQVLKDKRSKNIPPRKLEILSSLNTSGFDEKLQHKFNVVFGPEFETEMEKENNIAVFYELLIKYLFYADGGVGPALSTEYFEVPSKHLFMCNKCGLTDLHNQNQLITSIETKVESEADFSKALQFLSGVRVLTHCKCGPKEKKVLFCSLPSTLIFQIDNTTGLTVDKCETLDFNTSIEHCYDLNSTKFCLKSILCKEGESYVSIIKTPNGFVKEENLTKTFEENFIVSDLSNFEQLHLFYSKSVGIIQSFLANLSIENMSLNQLQVLNIKLDRKLPKKIATKKTSFGVRITQSFINGLTGKTSWVTSDHINVYLKLLAEKSTNSVHVVDSSWFSDVLIKSKNPQELQWYLNRLESKTIKWFDSQFIVIPVNENSTHWTLLVIDTEKRKIIYCNSLGNLANAKYICFQIWRYMCFEALMHSGKILDKSDWSFVFYSEDIHFPKQTDGNSCGIYVCAVARAIIFNYRLPDEPNLVRFREIFATEIIEGALNEGMRSLPY